MEDETTGVAHSCHASPPNGWTYNGNVADWITEGNQIAGGGTIADFGTEPFSDANAQLGSNSSWVTMGSQTLEKDILSPTGSSTNYCAEPGAVGQDNESFSIKWNKATCG
jgi:hypothetical protein